MTPPANSGPDWPDPAGRSLAVVLARGAGGTFVLAAANAGLSFATAVFLARALGVKGYGIFAYAVSWITVLGIFARFGLDQVIGRYVAAYHQAGDWERIRGLLQFSFFAVAGSATVCLLGAGAVSWFVYRDAAEMLHALWLALLLLPVNALMVPCDAAQVGLQRVVPAQIPTLLVRPGGFLLALGAAWWLIPGALSTTVVLALYLLVGCASLAIAACLLRRALAASGAPVAPARPAYETRAWIASAVPLMLVGGAYLANANVDILMLGAMAGPEPAAVYKAATRGADLVLFALNVVNTPLAPLVARLHAAGERERLQRGVTASARVTLAVGALVAAVLVVFGRGFLGIFGPAFVGGRFALDLLCGGRLLSLVGGPAGVILMMTGHEQQFAGASVGAVLLNVALNALLIPIWGLDGAAVATAAATAAWACILVRLVWSSLRIDPTFLGRVT